MSDTTTPNRRDDPAEMSIERLKAILDAYGASATRWPAAERAAAVALLDASAEARRAHAEALLLDVVLDHASAPPPTPELTGRLHRQSDAPRNALAMLAGRLSRRWPERVPPRPALRIAGFILTMVLGVVIGLALPQGHDPGIDETRVAQVTPPAVVPPDTGPAPPDSAGPGADSAPANALALDESNPLAALSLVDTRLPSESRDALSADRATAADAAAGDAEGGPLSRIPLI